MAPRAVKAWASEAGTAFWRFAECGVAAEAVEAGCAVDFAVFAGETGFVSNFELAIDCVYTLLDFFG